jgi:outer membrane cobalamin receptor
MGLSINKLSAVIALILLCSLSCRIMASAHKADKPATDSLKTKRFTLQTIRVIGKLPSSTLGSVSTKELDSPASNQPVNIKESLQNEAAISVTAGTKDESNLRIRGFRKNETKVLIDGRPLNTGYFGSLDLQNLPLSDIKTVQILKGPVSSIYGNNTLGGVVNLISREPSTHKWAKLGLQFKRNNTNHLELSTSHRFTDWDYWVFLARDNTDGFVLSRDFVPTANENGDVRNHLQKTQYNLQMKSNFAISELHTIGFSAGYTFIDSKNLPSSVYAIGDEYRTFKDWQRYHTTIMSEYVLSESKQINTMLWMDGGADTYQTFQDEQHQTMLLDSTLKYKTLGFSPRLDLDLNDKASFKTGLRSEFVFSNRKDNGGYQDWTNNNVQYHNIFGHLEYQASSNLILSAGSGLTGYLNDFNNDLHTFVEPSAGAFYLFTDGASVSLSAGFNSAYPTMQQLYSQNSGNPHLKPQSALKYELSYQKPFQISSIVGTLGADLFHNNTSNLIEKANGIYQNLHQVKTYGTEAELLIKPFAGWELESHFAILKTTAAQDYKITESPRHSGKFISLCHLPWQSSLAFTSVYKDYRLSQDESSAYRILPSYWVHDVTFKQQFKNIKVTLGLDNVTDVDYQEEYGFPAPGRNINLGLEAEI